MWTFKYFFFKRARERKKIYRKIDCQTDKKLSYIYNFLTVNLPRYWSEDKPYSQIDNRDSQIDKGIVY